MVGGNLQENNHAVRKTFTWSFLTRDNFKIWPRLVELAGEAGIGVLTAANGNAENSGNYYLQMFASWGAQDPYWIPVQVKMHITLVNNISLPRKATQMLPQTPRLLPGKNSPGAV